MRFEPLLLLIFLTMSASQATIDNSLSDMPFNVSIIYLKDVLGVESNLYVKDALKNVGMKDITIGLKFPRCQRVFQLYVRYGDVLASKNYDIESAKICLSDFGIPIPLTSVCIKLTNIVIMPNGAKGNIVGDITIGQKVLQWRNSNIPIASFNIGADAECFKYKNLKTCVQDLSCGWCDEDGGTCMQARQDHRTDLCLFCPRCSFTTSTNNTSDRMAECLKKQSCGFCMVDGKCYAGDSLGPFDMKSTLCDATSFTGANAQDNQWRYEGSNGSALSNVGSGFIGATIGLVVGAVVVLLVSIIYVKRSKYQPL